MSEIAKLVERMRSADIAVQGPALQEAAQVATTLVGEAVNALSTTSNPGLIAEQVALFGSIVPLLERLLGAEEGGDELKTYAATLLLHFGSRTGVDLLLKMLRSRQGPLIHIASWMARARILEAREPLIELLKASDFKVDIYRTASLLQSLRAFGGEFPNELKAKIEREIDEPFRTTIVGGWS